MKIGRNDPCPCGSGKKFKKCHEGKEDELALIGMGKITDEISTKITSLPNVDYGRSKEILDALDIRELTGNKIGVRCIDLKSYSDLNIYGRGQLKNLDEKGGGLFINIYKTLMTDPDNIYLAISPNIDDSTFIHELAHVLDYLAGSKMMPGILGPIADELEIPVQHLEHPKEYGYWLDYLRKRFDIQLDADDSIVMFLYENGLLMEAKEIQEENGLILKSKSDRMFKFLSENSDKINEIIKNLPGYIGPMEMKND